MSVFLDISVPRLLFFEKWLEVRSHQQMLDELMGFVLSHNNIDRTRISNENSSDLKRHLSRCGAKIRKRYNRSNRVVELFRQQNVDWLENKFFTFPVRLEEEQPMPSMPSRSVGRPEKTFQESGEKSKKRKLGDLVHEDPDRLLHAAHLSLHSSGDRVKSKLLKKLAEEPSSSRAGTSFETRCKNSRPLSPEEALVMYIDSRLTKRSFCRLRKMAKLTSHDFVPSYHKLQDAKKACCLPEHDIWISETRAELPLQGLLDHTCSRLFKLESLALGELIETGRRSFTMLSKWGCDGSGRHAQYQQIFSDPSMTDSSLFLFSLVPLQLRPVSSAVATWENPIPGSPLYCRPIKFMFEKETNARILEEVELVKVQIESLVTSKIIVNGVTIEVSHDLLLTMVDGKVANALTGTKDSKVCYICKITPMQFDKMLERPSDITENYSFGLSTLHGWIRTYEFLLRLSYSLEVYQADREKKKLTPGDRIAIKKRKTKIQQDFLQELGIRVDFPKPGFGNTNDGNLARKFFQNSEVCARITGLEQSLIEMFGIILRTLSSNLDIDPEKFGDYASKTKNRLTSLYPWCTLSPTVHKILDHSAEVIRFHSVPVGILTEESQEARNKDCRRFRLGNTRKLSRGKSNFDLLSMLMISSDPFIASFREKAQKTDKDLDPIIKGLLKEPDDDVNALDETAEEEGSDSE